MSCDDDCLSHIPHWMDNILVSVTIHHIKYNAIGYGDKLLHNNNYIYKAYHINVRYTDVIGCTVKPVCKGHCDEGTPCNQGTLSQNRVLSSPMLKNL